MSFGAEVGTAVKNGICSLLAAGNALEDFVRTVVNPSDPNYGYRARLIYNTYCRMPPPPPTAPPFEGGQCEFCYVVQVTLTVNDPGGPTTNGQATTSVGLWGPITAPRLTQVVENGSFIRYRYVVTSYGTCAQPRLANPTDTPITNDLLKDTGVFTIDNVAVTPVGGQPDTCGDIPPGLPPDDPSARKFPIDFNFDYNDGTDFNIKGDVYFGLAYFDNDFNLNVPLKFVLDNDVQFNADFNFNTGDINLNFGGDNNYPSPPPPEGDYRPDNDTPPPPPTVEPPPPGFEPPYPPNDDPDEEDSEDFDDEQPPIGKTVRRMIGVLVDTTLPPKMPSQIEQDDNPVVYAPDIGLVNFGYIIGGNRFYWGEDVRVKNRRQVIWTPEGRYAAEVRGTIRQGGEWVLTPIYARVPEDSVFQP